VSVNNPAIELEFFSPLGRVTGKKIAPGHEKKSYLVALDKHTYKKS
jgi:hypothetical protein